MKKNKLKNKLPKYEFGSLVENPATELYENQIAWTKAAAKAGNNDWVKGLKVFGNLAQQVGTSMMNKGMANGEGADGKGVAGFLNKNNDSVQSGMGMMGAFSQFLAMGGEVGGIPVEVEGEEVGQTPQGKLMEFDGPSHEQGGIPMNLPEGTEIYSKRIKVDGVSMADRKKKREKKTMTLESLFEKNKTDALLKNSLSRTAENNKKEEDADNKIQQTVKQLLDSQEGSNVQEHKWGNPVFGPQEKEPYPSFMNNFGNPDMFKTTKNQFDTPENNALLQKLMGGISDNASLENGVSDQNQSWDSFVQTSNKKYPGDVKDSSIVSDSTKKESPFKDIFGGMTAGDAMSIAGNWFQSEKIMKDIMDNRAGDTPNVNAFKDYGKEGLETLDKTKGYVNQVRDEKLKDAELNRTGTIKRNNNSARGINTLRALNLATDAQVNNQKEDTYNTFAEQMMGILGQEAGMKNQRDQVVMGGEQERDLNDRKDRDNFFTQLVTGHKNQGETISQTGKDFNKMKERGVMQKSINNMMDYVEIDSNGNIKVKPGAKLVGNKVVLDTNGKSNTEPTDAELREMYRKSKKGKK